MHKIKKVLICKKRNCNNIQILDLANESKGNYKAMHLYRNFPFALLLSSLWDLGLFCYRRFNEPYSHPTYNTEGTEIQVPIMHVILCFLGFVLAHFMRQANGKFSSVTISRVILIEFFWTLVMKDF